MTASSVTCFPNAGHTPTHPQRHTPSTTCSMRPVVPSVAYCFLRIEESGTNVVRSLKCWQLWVQDRAPPSRETCLDILTKLMAPAFDHKFQWFFFSICGPEPGKIHDSRCIMTALGDRRHNLPSRSMEQLHSEFG